MKNTDIYISVMLKLLSILILHFFPCKQFSYKKIKWVDICKQIENNDFSKLTVYFLKHDNFSKQKINVHLNCP